ncbi:MAG: RNA degradosome polyphosphate kinase [Clostridiales bacterium]|nr:RNA degradosome polyphosphate kinase [Clostridiales bacterium]
MKREYMKPEYFENRELSWIGFDERVLGEARDKTNPLFERLKFLSITASNLDEFFMVRVASLKDMVNAEYSKKDISGMTPEQQLEAIHDRVHGFVNMQYSTWQRSLLPGLKQCGLQVIGSYSELTAEQTRYVNQYFMENVYPVLTPMAVDSSRPFPLIVNKTLNMGALLKKKNEQDGELEFATVQVPAGLPRIVEVPSAEANMKTVILLEEIIAGNMPQLFLSYDVLCAHPYRIMRNADLPIDEDEASDLLKEIQKQLRKRQWGEVIRLEVDEKTDKQLLKILKKEFEIRGDAIYRIGGPLDLTFLMKMYGLEGFEEYKQPKYIPQPVPELTGKPDIFEEIRKRDILLHHPYQTFDPVVDLVKKAAKDPQVLAIKQTLYRVSGNSPIIAALAQAAENGKQVSVLVELKARFDEENNIAWAKMLERAGCHVIYGLVGLKTHSKITLVVRREEDGIRRYVHLGTGNYNDSTAKLYTDMGLLTCSEPIGEDATAVFNMLSGYSEPASWNKLSLAPLWLRDRFLTMIQRETAYARNGEAARIVAKMNSLCDPGLIEALYEASAAGVKIDLIVRGICSLKVGIPGVSENITVRSIVGTFLEHSRIYYFLNGGQEDIYLSSADWMPRNLDRRVEILFPVENEQLKKEVQHVLEIQLQDTVKAQIKQPDGTYAKIDRRGKQALSSQEYFMEYAVSLNKIQEDVVHDRVFVPAEPVEDRDEE